MLTRAGVIEKVNSFTQELIAHGIPIERVILFGSYAKNQQREDSDIDVALFSNIFSGFGFEDKQLFALINVKKDYIDIETKTFPSQTYYEQTPLAEMIEKTGIELFNVKDHSKNSF
jgi:predicted nucleotidyltransferase